MRTTMNWQPKAEPVQDAPAGTALQERIDAMIAKAIKRRPQLSPEEQHKKNQSAIEMLNKWDEEDKTDAPEEIARRTSMLSFGRMSDDMQPVCGDCRNIGES